MEGIGLIAGDGNFPIILSDGLRKNGKRVIAVGLDNITSPDLERNVDRLHWIEVGQLGKLIKIFKKEGIKKVVMAGKVSKTFMFKDIRPDLRAISLYMRLKDRKDDSLLLGIVSELEKEHIKVEEPTRYVPHLLAEKGVITKRKPKKTYSVKNQNKVTSFFEKKTRDDEVIILHLETDADELKSRMNKMELTDQNRTKNIGDPTPYHMPLSVMPSKDQSTGYVPSSTREPDFDGEIVDIEDSKGEGEKATVNLPPTIDLYTRMLKQRDLDNMALINSIARNDNLDFKNEKQDTKLTDLGEESIYKPYEEDAFVTINDNAREKAGLLDTNNRVSTLQGIKSYRSLKVKDEDTDPFDLRLTTDERLGDENNSNRIDPSLVYDVNKKRDGIYIKDSLNYRVKSTSLRPTIQRTVIHPTLQNILNCNDLHEWPQQTNIHCWWCCHQFDGPPVALPKKYNSKTKQFYVLGNFCSFNCAEAYRLDNKKEYLVAGVLCMMYNILTDGDLTELNPAPPRTALDIFGGPLSIEQFRNASLSLHKYSVINPPLIAIVHQIEESWAEPMPRSHTGGGKSIFKSNVGDDIKGSGAVAHNKDKSHLRLKRSKPLPNSKNTLDQLLKITTVKRASSRRK